MFVFILSNNVQRSKIYNVLISFRTAMHAGAYNDHVECLELLEQHNGNIDAVDVEGYSPLMVAAQRGHERAIGMFDNLIHVL